MGLGVRLCSRTSGLNADSLVYFQTRALLLLCRCASIDFYAVDDIDACRLQPFDCLIRFVQTEYDQCLVMAAEGKRLNILDVNATNRNLPFP
jgi:hypothetical protein